VAPESKGRALAERQRRNDHATDDPARLVAFRALRDVTADRAYANLALSARLREVQLAPRDAAFATELVGGTMRSRGALDAIIEAAAGRPLGDFQPAVIDVLRLGAYQLLRLRVPPHAAVGTSVDLASQQIGHRVSGLVNAVLRRVARNTWDEWIDKLTDKSDALDALALRTSHPRWIVEALADVLPPDELEAALLADNAPAFPTLAARPGLMERDDLVAMTRGRPTALSPWGVATQGDPGAVPAIQDGRAGVQDEGSQLVVLAASRAIKGLPKGPWLDLCAGPGGKTALLRGLVGPVVSRRRGAKAPKTSKHPILVAADAQPHRARLVAANLRAFDAAGHVVVAADGTRPPWPAGSFSFVLADVPCSGLGALRRRADARWSHEPADLAELSALQDALLSSALALVKPGGLVAYSTCSPHRSETSDVVFSVAARTGAVIEDASSLLPEVPDCAARTDERFVQLWPHRHGTDAMFLALLRRPDQ